MYDRIAVIQNENNEVSTLEECRKIQIFRETESGWQTAAEIYWQIGDFSSIAYIRNGIWILTEQLGDCSIIVGRKIAGIPYHIFDKQGFHIFEADCQVSQELFCSIKKELMESQAKSAKSSGVLSGVPQKPYSPENDGIYYLNLIELQQAFPEISSKKALQQFMEEVPFLRLNLICSHFPPWMEAAALRKNLITHIETLENGHCNVVILAKGCDES